MSRLGVPLKDDQPLYHERIELDPRLALLERQAREERAARRRKAEIGWLLAAGGLLICAVAYFR